MGINLERIKNLKNCYHGESRLVMWQAEFPYKNKILKSILSHNSILNVELHKIRLIGDTNFR